MRHFVSCLNIKRKTFPYEISCFHRRVNEICQFTLRKIPNEPRFQTFPYLALRQSLNCSPVWHTSTPTCKLFVTTFRWLACYVQQTPTREICKQCKLAVAMFFCPTKLWNRTPKAAELLPECNSFVGPSKSSEREDCDFLSYYAASSGLVLSGFGRQRKPDIVVNTSSNPIQVLNIRFIPPRSV